MTRNKNKDEIDPNLIIMSLCILREQIKGGSNTNYIKIFNKPTIIYDTKNNTETKLFPFKVVATNKEGFVDVVTKIASDLWDNSENMKIELRDK